MGIPVKRSREPHLSRRRRLALDGLESRAKRRRTRSRASCSGRGRPPGSRERAAPRQGATRAELGCTRGSRARTGGAGGTPSEPTPVRLAASLPCPRRPHRMPAPAASPDLHGRVGDRSCSGSTTVHEKLIADANDAAEVDFLREHHTAGTYRTRRDPDVIGGKELSGNSQVRYEMSVPPRHFHVKRHELYHGMRLELPDRVEWPRAMPGPSITNVQLSKDHRGEAQPIRAVDCAGGRIRPPASGRARKYRVDTVFTPTSPDRSRPTMRAPLASPTQVRRSAGRARPLDHGTPTPRSCLRSSMRPGLGTGHAGAFSGRARQPDQAARCLR